MATHLRLVSDKQEAAIPHQHASHMVCAFAAAAAQIRYGCAFASNAAGQVVADRAYNTAALLRAYYGDGSSGATANNGAAGGRGDQGTNAAASAATARASNSEESLQRRIRWNIDDPNSLAVDLPGALLFLRVSVCGLSRCVRLRASHA